MGLFSRIRGFFSKANEADFEADAREEAISHLIELDIPVDELHEIWDTVEEDIGSPDLFKEFTVDNAGAELFATGWIDKEVSHDERMAAREEYFDLMDAYDVSDFDWDAWRDWYEDS